MAETVTAPNPTEATTTTTPAATTTTVAETPGSQQTATLLSTESTPEAKPAATTEEKPAAETKPEGAPEKYEFKAPDGTEYDPQILDAFSVGAKEANLTQDAAQKLLEKVAPVMAERQAQQVEAVRKGWLDSSTADKEFGGEHIKENIGVAKKALDTFATPELRTLLDTTGLGNHPEVIRFFYRTGKAISEDKFVGGSANPKGAVNPATILYDNTKKE